jgi:hypothetical protein
MHGVRACVCTTGRRTDRQEGRQTDVHTRMHMNTRMRTQRPAAVTRTSSVYRMSFTFGRSSSNAPVSCVGV